MSRSKSCSQRSGDAFRRKLLSRARAGSLWEWGLLGAVGSGLLGLTGCVLSRPLPGSEGAQMTERGGEEKAASHLLSSEASGAVPAMPGEVQSESASEAKGTIGAAPMAGETELSREQIVNRLKELYGSLESALRFQTGDWVLSAAAQDQLREFARLLKLAPDLRVKISGFADNVGPREANVALSKKRADAVREVLVAEGVEPAQVAIEAMGEKAPVASNATPVGRSLNRRVEIETPSG